jgi:hypothetical protein
MSPKFLKFERVQNVDENFQIAQKQKSELSKLNKIGQNYVLISPRAQGYKKNFVRDLPIFVLSYNVC